MDTFEWTLGIGWRKGSFLPLSLTSEKQNLLSIGMGGALEGGMPCDGHLEKDGSAWEKMPPPRYV